MNPSQHHSNIALALAIPLLFAGLVVAGCQDRPEPPIAPIDADATGMAGGGGYGGTETAADGPALILHAEEVEDEDPSDPPVFDCDEEHPDTEADAGELTDIFIYAKVPAGGSLAGLQVAFEWPASWEFLGWMGTYQPHSIAALTPTASGPTAGTLAIAFDCVSAGGTAVPIGAFRIRPGPSGCLHLVQSAWPNGNHAVNRERGDRDPRENWGPVCAEDDGSTLCGTKSCRPLRFPMPANGATAVTTASGLDLACKAPRPRRHRTYRALMPARGRLASRGHDRAHRASAGPFRPRLYQWKAVAADLGGAEQADLKLTTARRTPPTALTNPAPADGATGVAVKKTTLRWLGGDDPEGKQAGMTASTRRTRRSRRSGTRV
jgi:hypothetical protein